MRPNLFYSAGCLFRLGWATLITIAVLALVKQFIFDIIPVSGQSMFPTFHDRDWIVLNKLSYSISQPERGDSVVLRFPGDPDNARYIKRIIGLPGEKISIHTNKVFINGKELREAYIDPTSIAPYDLETELKADQYYLLGDNRPVSSDSHIWGPATSDNFIGKAYFIILPPKRFQPVLMPLY
jgi:signal peptidase I